MLYISVSSGEKGGGEWPPILPQDSRQIFEDEVNGFSSLTFFFMFTPSLPHTPSQVIYAQMFTDDITIYSRIFPSMCLLQHSFKVAYFLFLDKAHDLTFLENTPPLLRKKDLKMYKCRIFPQSIFRLLAV
jgi:hypothetical protein